MPERALARSLLLERRAPLLTLTGPGGVGKTRLGLAIAHDVAKAYADGGHWVDLAPLADAALVPGALAAALDVVPPANRPLREELARHLGSRQTLLLLDNCEHVLSQTAELVAWLLSACPNVQVLATSRAPLHIRAEHVFPVEPLPLPDENAGTPGELAENESVRLFVERARAVRPEFTFDHHSAQTVAELCRQLDGLPLAIELAAARSRLLPVQALLDQMSTRLSWLSDGPRDLPARQRTVHDTIAWSHELLGEEEQRIFRGLSCFAGGFTLPAAQSVLDRAGIPSGGIWDALTTLADQGLVRRVGPEHAPRFMMLETIRDFGREQLAASGASEAVGMAHAAYFLEFAELHHPNRIDGQERVEDRLQRIEAELANLRAALAWFAGRGDSHSLLRLAAALAVYWHLRTHLQEGQHWLERALNGEPGEDPLVRGRALVRLALIRWAQNQYEQAAIDAQASLEIAERCGDVELAADALHVLGMAAEIQDDWETAEAHLSRARDRWRELGARPEEAWALTLLCRVALGRGHTGLAARHARQALSLFREVGHPVGVATALSRLAEIARQQGDDPRAAAAFHEALQIWSDTGDRWLVTLALAGLADLAAAHNQAGEAARLIGFIDTLARQTGSQLLSAAQLSRDRAEAGALAHLDDTQFAALHAQGSTRRLDQAIALAATIVVPDHGRNGSNALVRLTAREMEILRLMAGMRTDREIADVLFLSRRTVSGHVTHILSKLGVTSRGAAVRRSRRLGLLPDPEP